MLSGSPRTRCHTTRIAKNSSVLNITSDWTYNRLCGRPHNRFWGAGGCDSPRLLTKSPAITKWLAAHPRFHVHYTPTYSSWINQVERWFAYLTSDLLQRGDHRSVQALEADIRAWIKDLEREP